MRILFVYMLLKLVSHYGLNVLSVSVTGLKKSLASSLVGWMG